MQTNNNSVDIVTVKSYGWQIVGFVEVYGAHLLWFRLGMIGTRQQLTCTDDKILPTKYQFPIDTHYGFVFVLFASCEGRTQFYTLAGKTVVWYAFDLQSIRCDVRRTMTPKKYARRIFNVFNLQKA